MARHLRQMTPEPTRVPAKILNYCSACDQDFGGERAFDLHRVGDHAYDYTVQHPDGRRCLTPDEMLGRGMYLNSSGRWSQPHNGRSERLGLRSQTTEEHLRLLDHTLVLAQPQMLVQSHTHEAIAPLSNLSLVSVLLNGDSRLSDKSSEEVVT